MAAPATRRRGGAGETSADEAHRQPTPPHKQPGVFGQQLRDLRAKHGLSQAAVARLAGVSPGYVGLIETGDRGHRPSLDIVKRLGQAVDASILEMEALLRSAGHLGPDETLVPRDRPTFAQFVDADRRLSRMQKTLLKGLYESWLGDE